MGTTHQEILISRPADEVWSEFRDFHELRWAPNVVSEVTRIGDNAGDQPGAGRP